MSHATDAETVSYCSPTDLQPHGRGFTHASTRRMGDGLAAKWFRCVNLTRVETLVVLTPKD
eukprot:992945-Prymnesium_polylepis.1